MTKIINDIELAAKEIVKGNVVALPTETVYGLGANALDESAVLKIYETKNRPHFNPIIVHVHEANDFEKYAQDIPSVVYELAEKFSPGPISFVLKKRKNIPDIVTSGNDSVGLRIPSHKMFREILRLTKLPVAAPSANMFGKISPTTAEDVLKDLNGKINYILDGGKCEIGIESTVVSFLDEKIEILRHGYVSKMEIEQITGKINDSEMEKLLSPGRLKSHYVPATPLYMTENFEELKQSGNKKIGFLDFSKYDTPREIALNLFSDMRKLDETKYDFIVYKTVPEEGLGIAINDRLKRASSGRVDIGSGEISIREF